MIKEAWEAQKEIREVMVFLQGHGVSSTYAVKIFKQYGKEAITVVQENPYRLAQDIFGIGFITADKIAKNLGVPPDSLMRSEAGILYVLYQLTDEGHVYYPYEELIENARKYWESKGKSSSRHSPGWRKRKKSSGKTSTPQGKKLFRTTRQFTCQGTTRQKRASRES